MCGMGIYNTLYLKSKYAITKQGEFKMNKRRVTKWKQFNARVYEHQHDELKRLSAISDRSVSALVREALEKQKLISRR